MLAMSLIETVIREGLIYGLMAMGVFITYRILDFPDLSVEGTFPFGACAAAALIGVGVNPWLVCILTFILGCGAGCVTGLLHVKIGISDLLSGILVMTGMWSVNLFVTGGTAIKQFFNQPTIFTSGLGAHLPGALKNHNQLVIALLIAVVVKVSLDWFLQTKKGLLLRAVGNNSLFVTNLGKNAGRMKILGLALGNGCTALSGCVLAQLNENADINYGKGMVVLALASVIIGATIFKRVRFLKLTTMAILGAIVYKACLQAALQLHLPNSSLKLIMAVLLTCAILVDKIGKKAGEKREG